METEKIKIALVDDHKIVRDGIKAMLMAYDEFVIAAETDDAESMLKIIDTLGAVVLILDLVLPGMDGNSFARKVASNYPDIKILVLSSDISEQTILESVSSGVKGYISKDASTEEFIQAIKTIAGGEEYFGGKISGIIFKSYISKINGNNTKSDVAPAEQISQREKEVLEGFANGLSYKEIAAKLFISPRTVESHRNSIMEKLELNSLADLIKYAIKKGIIRL